MSKPARKPAAENVIAFPTVVAPVKNNGLVVTTADDGVTPVMRNTRIKKVPKPKHFTQLVDFEKLPKASKRVVDARLKIVAWVQSVNSSETKAIQRLLAEGKTQSCLGYGNSWLDQEMLLALGRSTKSGKLPGLSTVQSWLQIHRDTNGDLAAMADKRVGRTRVMEGWELDFLQRFHIPSKPTLAAVVRWIEEDGGQQITARKARTLIESLGEEWGHRSKWRVGVHYYALNEAPHKTIDREAYVLGEMWQGDGHTIDVYLRHPSGTARPYRLEITAWMDLRSRYIVAIGFSNAESSLSTLWSISEAIVHHNHVPIAVHIDAGSGFQAQMLSAEGIGYYDKMGITTKNAIPGNAKGKGDIEGWFRILRENHDKRYGVDYCGNDQAAESNRRMTTEIEAGRRQLLASVDDYKASVLAYVKRYNAQFQKALGCAPADLWQHLDNFRNEVGVPASALMRPSVERTARRGRVKLEGRTYEHVNLMRFQRKVVEVEYSVVDDSKVWVYDKDRLVCEAPLLKKVEGMPSDRREQAKLKSDEARLRRLQKHVDTHLQESRVLDQAQESNALIELDAELQADVIEHDDTPNLEHWEDEQPSDPFAPDDNENSLDLELFLSEEPEDDNDEYQ